MTCLLQLLIFAHEPLARGILQDGARKIDGFFLPLEATYHQAPFERAGNLRGQFLRLNIAPDLASLLASSTMDWRRSSHELKACRALDRSRGLPSSESMAVFSSGQPPGKSGAPVPKVTDNLFQPVNRTGDTLCSSEASIHRKFPGMVKRLSSELLFARKVTVDSTFLEPCRSHEIGEGCAVVSSLILKIGAALRTIFCRVCSPFRMSRSW
jgi:hypothetical protein